MISPCVYHWSPPSGLIAATPPNMHLQRSQLSGRTAFRASRPHHAPIAAAACRSRSTVKVQAFFNFLAPKAGAAVAPKARELSDALLEIVSQTKPGAAVSPVTKAEIEELVGQLGCRGAAMRRRLLVEGDSTGWGERQGVCGCGGWAGGVFRRGGGAGTGWFQPECTTERFTPGQAQLACT